eukprot:TRINITY_DN9957_c0_g1_i1.p1 TRINITY_DN9957_c0_g1~~TRINITY_DN9957_c0_g1_i1.p1  ORF type:complete len:480 (-),score=69.27 TRINITY_DN9957_c0_g1_i1:36-1475(-)
MIAVVCALLVVLGGFMYWFINRDRFVGLDARIPSIPNTSNRWWGVVTSIDPTNYFNSFTRWSFIHGPIWKFIMLGQPHIQVSSAALVKDLLLSPDFTDKPKFAYGTLADFLGPQSLVIVNGEKWRIQRRLLSKVFQSQNMRSFVGHFRNAAEELIAVLKENAPMQAVDVDLASMKLAMDVITSAMFSKNFDIQRNPHAKFPTAVSSCLHEIAERLHNPLRRFNLFASGRFAANRAYMVQEFGAILQEHRQRGMQSQPDLVDLMLSATDDQTGAVLSDEDMYSQCLTFFLAGHDTTAHTLAWALYEVGMHSDVEQTLLQELQQVLGEQLAPDYDQLGQLKYTQAILKETLRLHPPVATFSRECARDSSLGGYTIPKGTACAVDVQALHMNPDHWVDPFKFIPDRFMDDAAESELFAWLPFSLKERACIGSHFALLEMKTVLAMVVRQLVVRCDPLKPPRARSNITQQPADGIWMYARSRT